MAETHVVQGSGQIGSALARALVGRGHDVFAVRRSAAKEGADRGVRTRSGDVAQAAFAAEVARGASVLYHVMSPAYHRWGVELPPLTDAVLHAARSSGARLVVLDNLYMFGRMGGAPMREDSPQAPCSKKGVLRKAMAERYLEASAKGEIQLVAGPEETRNSGPADQGFFRFGLRLASSASRRRQLFPSMGMTSA